MVRNGVRRIETAVVLALGEVKGEAPLRAFILNARVMRS